MSIVKPCRMAEICNPQYDGPKKFNSMGYGESTIITNKCNIGYILGNFLWFMRGSNNLEQIAYYSRHVEEYTDNNLELRGALGPRLNYWIGPDQLQEAIRTNQDIDEEEEFVKPAGVNQIECMYDDLTNQQMLSTVAVVRNPALDFDVSNDIPDLVSVSFSRDENNLDMHLHYCVADVNENFPADVEGMKILWLCMANWIGIVPNKLTIYANNFIKNNDYLISKLWTGLLITDTGNFEEFNADMQLLLKFESHLRAMIKPETFDHREVSVNILTKSLESIIIDEIKSTYWKNVAYTLLVYSIRRFAPDDQDFEDYILEILNKLSCQFLVGTCLWLKQKGGLRHDIKRFIERVMDGN